MKMNKVVIENVAISFLAGAKAVGCSEQFKLQPQWYIGVIHLLCKVPRVKVGEPGANRQRKANAVVQVPLQDTTVLGGHG